MARKPDWLKDFITEIIEREGGLKYENVANDRGGPTKAGITIGRLRTERGRDKTVEDLKALTEDDIRQIYESAYYIRPRIHWLPDQIQRFAMDFWTTSGTNAAEYLQRLLVDVGFDLAITKEFDAETCEAAHMAQQAMGDDLLRAYVVERAHFFARINANDDSQGKFLRGWINGRCRPFFKGSV